jgi:hypothetical protein
MLSRMSRRRGLVGVVLLLLVAALVISYVGTVQHMHRLGVRGWTPRAAGPCVLAVRLGYLSCGSLPTDLRAPSTEGLMVAIRVWTGAITGFHSWSLPDSASWVATRDSVRHSLARAGGTALECRLETSSPDEAGLEYEVWRFPGQSMRLIATSKRHRWSVGSRWLVNLTIAERPLLDCEPAPPRRRLLTPKEMIQRAMEY